MEYRFFVSHIFFLVAFLGLLCALITVVRRRNQHLKGLILVSLPVCLIFLTAYLGKHLPEAHRVLNIFYDALLIYNGYYFWSIGQRWAFIFYLIAIISTALDFAMHFVIRPI